MKRCSFWRALNTKPESLVKEFESGLKPGVDDYSRRLVEFCSLKALEPLSCNLSEKINNGEFSRFTYDMMLAWEKPTPLPDKHRTMVNNFLILCMGSNFLIFFCNSQNWMIILFLLSDHSNSVKSKIDERDWDPLGSDLVYIGSY